MQRELAARMTGKAGLLPDHWVDAGDEANMDNFTAGAAAVNCIDKAIAVLGGNAGALEYQVISYQSI